MADAVAMIQRCSMRQRWAWLPDDDRIYGPDHQITVPDSPFLLPSDQGIVGAVPLSCEDV